MKINSIGLVQNTSVHQQSFDSIHKTIRQCMVTDFFTKAGRKVGTLIKANDGAVVYERSFSNGTSISYIKFPGSDQVRLNILKKNGQDMGMDIMAEKTQNGELKLPTFQQVKDLLKSRNEAIKAHKAGSTKSVWGDLEELKVFA